METTILPPELLSEVERFITENKDLGYTTIEDFFRDTARWRIKTLSGTIECIEIHKKLYDKAKTAIDDLELPYMSVSDFVEEQIKKLAEQHDQYIEQKIETE